MIIWYKSRNTILMIQTVLGQPTNMKFLVAFVLAVAYARPDVSHVVRSQDADATVLKSGNDVSPEGFEYVYETSNGIYSAANGIVKNANSDSPAQEVKGEFKFTSPEGIPFSLTYIANEDGFQPQGDHLPVAPPVPEQIARALEYIAAHPHAEDKYPTGARVAQTAAQVVSKPPQAFNKPSSAFAKPYKF